MILSTNRAHSAQQGVSFFFSSSFRWRATHEFESVGFSAWQLSGSGSTRGGGEVGKRDMFIACSYMIIYITALSETWVRLKQPRVKIESPSVGLRATNDGRWLYSLTNPFTFRGP